MNFFFKEKYHFIIEILLKANFPKTRVYPFDVPKKIHTYLRCRLYSSEIPKCLFRNFVNFCHFEMEAILLYRREYKLSNDIKKSIILHKVEKANILRRKSYCKND